MGVFDKLNDAVGESVSVLVGQGRRCRNPVPQSAPCAPPVRCYVAGSAMVGTIWWNEQRWPNSGVWERLWHALVGPRPKLPPAEPQLGHHGLVAAWEVCRS